ncbi:MAG TPA: tetratricopeptide repeat protein [Ktedonobacterales bacterium]
MGRSGAGWDDEWDAYDERPAGRSGGPASGGRASRGPSASQVSSALREAQQLQQDGNLDEAIALCEDLLSAGVDRSDARYFLGWLYQEAERWEEAAEQFQTLLADPEYALSCYYALGQCARAQGDIQEAAQYFDEAVDRVNLDALTRDESDQLLQLCQEAAEAHREMGDLEGSETVYSALLGFLRSRGWQDQVDEIERLMAESAGGVRGRQRRPTGSPQQRPGGNIPQRQRGPANSGGPMRRPRASAAPPPPPAPPPPQPSAPIPSVTGMSNAMAAMSTPMGAMSGQMGAMSAQMGAIGGQSSASIMGDAFGGGGFGLSTPPGQDPLADLMSSLSNSVMGPSRSGMPNLPEPQRTQVAQAVRDIGNYVAHGLLTAAIEECLRVIEIAPQYLDVHLMLGEIYVRQGKIEQAIAKYAILVDTYLVNGRVDDAIATYRRILQLEPNNLTYRVKLIELLGRQGRTDEVLRERMSAADSYLRLGYADRAIQEYEQALLANPNNIQVRLNYAQALMKAGRGPQAVGEYQRVLQVDPTNVNALSRFQIALDSGIGSAPGMGGSGAGRAAALEVLARLLKAMRAESMRSYEEVIREYLLALESSPANADLRYAMGQIHLAAGRSQEALTSFQQIANTPGMEVLARFGAGQALLQAGDPASATRAVAELEQASAVARQTPPEPTVWAARPRADNEDRLAPELEISMLLARAYQLAGQMDQVQQTLQAVKDQRPYNDEVYRALAEVSAKQGDVQAQLREFSQLVRHYRNNRMVENAITVLREMARLAPDDPAVRSELADIHVQRGLLDEGLAELRQLADIHMRRGQLKDAATVFQSMAEIDWNTGKHDDAINLLYQAIGYSTDDMPLRRTLVQYCILENRQQEAAQQQAQIAEFFYKARQTKEAVEALQQLIAMDKANLDAYEMLGQTYAAVGEYVQAERVYRNLARIDPTSELARARLAELQSVRARMG